MSENSIEFSLSNSEQRDSWLNSGHWTLDADIEMIRYILHFAGLSLRYWGEMFLYATHIQSLSLTTGLDSMVPFKAWTG